YTTKGHIKLHELAIDAWVFFFCHPADFTPVCTTDMGRTAQLAEEFAKRNVKPLGLSTDTVEEHKKWIEDVNDTQNTSLDFPIVADPDLTISKLYDMIHPGESATEAVRTRSEERRVGKESSSRWPTTHYRPHDAIQ